MELLRNKKRIKRCGDGKRNWFWSFEIWNTWNGENIVTNKETNFVFAQLTNWDKFSDEDNTGTQEVENDSTSSGITKEHKITKTQ